MSNYIEFGKQIAFHPGYYIKEYIDNVGLTQEEFACRLGTTPKNISYLIRGEQSISADIAYKLSRMLGTSMQYWLNLQNKYNQLVIEFENREEINEEKEILNQLKYSYFRDNFNLPDIPKQIDEQVKLVREFLNVSSLTVFKKRDMYVRFRSACLEQSISNVVKANVMVQLAMNISLKHEDFPRFDKKQFVAAAKHALTLTKQHDNFFEIIKKEFYFSGVDLIALPNISGSKINGATRKIGSHIMLMINDRNSNADSFWFTLFHEIGHIINGDYGLSFEDDAGEIEEIANRFAEDSLIPVKAYNEFCKKGYFTPECIDAFANKINRDPCIILGRLQKDQIISYSDSRYKHFRSKIIFK